MTLQELGDAESALQAALLSTNYDVLDAMLDEAVTYTGPDGRCVTKSEEMDAYRSGAVSVRRFVELRRVLRSVESLGVSWVLADVEGVAGGEPFAARLQYTRTWLHTDRWRVVAAHASQLVNS